MTDGLREAMEDALPKGSLPFAVDGVDIAAAGRRIRRRRRWGMAGAATAAVVTAAVLLPGILSGFAGPNPPSTASSLSEGWTLQAQDPFTDDVTDRVTEAFGQVAATVVPYASMSGVDSDSADFGRYLETSPDGERSRPILLASGEFSITPSQPANGFQIAVLPPGSGDVEDFIDCGAGAAATCGPDTGENGEQIMFGVEQLDNEFGVSIERFNIVVIRPDSSVVEMMLYPHVDDRPESSDVVTKPLMSPEEAGALALGIPQDLKI